MNATVTRTSGWGCCVGLGLLLLFSSAVLAAPSGQTARTHAPPQLLDLWFKLQATGPVYAPYAYIRHRDTAAAQMARKKTLLEELDNLIWRLQAAGNAALADALGQWRRHIRAADHYRTPGRWGPAALLSGARNGVPMTAVAAVGACRVPGWIEIWSAQGVQRIAWQPGMRLSTLLSDDRVLHDTQAQEVTVITPYGESLDYGIAAWNAEDAPLSPGMRVIVPLPLGGQAAAWLDSTLSAFLVHLLPGDRCRQITLEHGRTDETD